MKQGLNPHDRYFKENMGDPEIARDFMRSYLPKALCENMDFSSLSIQKDSYVDGKLLSRRYPIRCVFWKNSRTISEKKVFLN